MMIIGNVSTTPTIATWVGNTSAYAKSSRALADRERDRLAPADAHLLERVPHATLLRSDEDLGPLARELVGGKHVGNLIGASGARVQHFLDDFGDSSVQGMRSARNASTAISLAALSTAGAVPPTRPAS